MGSIDINQLLGHTDWIRALALDILRDRDRAEDVVQETYLAALQHLDSSDRDGPRLRAWLKRVASNFALMARRGEARRERRESEPRGEGTVPSTAETLERVALQREVADAILTLDPIERDIVSLRYYDGLPPQQIAKRLGLTPAAVSARLTRAKQSLRVRLDAASEKTGRDWALIALSWSASSGAAEWVLPTTVTGGLAMKSIVKFAAALAAIVFLGFATAELFPLEPSAGNSLQNVEIVELEAEERAEPAKDAATIDEVDERVAALPVEEEAPIPVTAPATTGRIRVEVRDAESGSPAPGVAMKLYLPKTQQAWFHNRERVTDDEGVAWFDDVAPGKATIYLERVTEKNTFGAESVIVEVGSTAEVAFEVVRGERVVGVVLDSLRRPVAGAEIWLGAGTGAPRFATRVTNTDENGEFELRHVSELQAISARRAGFAPSLTIMPLFFKEEGNEVIEVELTLPDVGGAIDGVVIDTLGNPIAEAIVVVGREGISELHKIDGRVHYDPASIRVRTDRDGAFRIEGVAPGTTALRCRGLGFSTLREEVEVPRGGVTNVRLELVDAATIVGKVSHSDGRPVVGARAYLPYDVDMLNETRASVASDGTFELTGVPVGEVTVVVDLEGENLAVQATVETRAGDVSNFDEVFPVTDGIFGRLVDANGLPLIGWSVRRETDDPSVAYEMKSALATTDADGRFRFEQSPVANHRMYAFSPGRWVHLPAATLEDVNPSAKEVQVVVPLNKIPDCALRGRVIDAAGQGIPAAKVKVRSSSLFLNVETDERGDFSIRHLPPDEVRIEVEVGDDAAREVGPLQLERGEEISLDPIRWD